MYHFINNYTSGFDIDDIDVLQIPNKIYSYIKPGEDYFCDNYGQSIEDKMNFETINQNGLYVVYNDDCYFAFTEHLDKNYREFKDSDDDKTYNIIVPAKWKTITLKEKLTKGGKTNSDTDSFTDWQEVIQDKIKVDEHGEIVLPMFNLAEAIDNMK